MANNKVINYVRGMVVCGLVTISSQGKGAVLCRGDMSKGGTCSVTVANMHPAQFALGMIEVQNRAAKIAAMSTHARNAYLATHIAPLVIGPGGTFYPTDRHHLARAMAIAHGESSTLNAVIQENWSHLSHADFWAAMESAHYVYLFDEHGVGPMAPESLPESILSMKNDPYRGLVWGVKEEGAIGDSDTPFYEFQWAQYFRGLIDESIVTSDFSAATAQAAALARSPAASFLPGYVGN